MSRASAGLLMTATVFGVVLLVRFVVMSRELIWVISIVLCVSTVVLSHFFPSVDNVVEVLLVLSVLSVAALKLVMVALIVTFSIGSRCSWKK